MNPIIDCCCGLDVHRDKICAAILTGDNQNPIYTYKEFGTSKKSLKLLVEWVVEHSCFFVAMESTGVYWKPVYEAFELSTKKVEIMVVNAYHMKNVPGRKTDAKDAEWIAYPYRSGLLKNSFISPKEFRALREQYRIYVNCVQDKVREVNRLEKFLQAHGFKFSTVMSDILGLTGRKLLDILVTKGELTEEDVLNNCKKLKADPNTIAEHICGSLDYEAQFTLEFILDSIDSHNKRIDKLVNHMIESTQFCKDQIDILTSIPGINQISAIGIISEITATPHKYFETGARLCNWTGLSPRNDESAEHIKSRKILPGNRTLKPLMVQCAWASVRTRKSHYHDWFWTRSGRLGQKRSIIAVSRKMLSLIHFLLLNSIPYDYLIASGLS